MSYKPAASGVPNGIVFFGTPAGEKVFEAESNFAYNPSTDTLSVDNISAATGVFSGDISAVNGTFSGDVTVVGDLNVSGVVNQVDSTNLLVEDVTITLRNGFTGTPASEDDASIIVNRGSSDDALITWDEDELLWTFDYGAGGSIGIREHVKGGEGISADDTSKPYRTLDLDINSLSEESTIDASSDFIVIYDDSASAHKKMTRSNFVSGLGAMSSFVLEDGDGTEVSIGDAQEVKFVEGGGIDINWTDTSSGTDADPFDLTFTVNVDTAQIADGAVTEAKRERTVATPSSNSSSLSDINLVTTGSSNLTMTLPSSPSDGQIVTVKKIDSGSGEVIISAGTDTIDGAGGKRLYYQYESLTCVYKTNAWYII